jgi:5'-3' exonuclease
VPKRPTTVLCDADVVLYRWASVAQKVWKWDPKDPEDVSVSLEPVEEIKDGIKSEIVDLMDATDADAVVLALTDEVNWRKAVLPSYKGNRTVRPLMLAELREWAAATFKTFKRPTLEGDDILGILATSNIIPGRVIVSSIDKDLRTVPCTLYNPMKQELVTISEEEADWWHLMQTMMGDVVDNYKGIPGIGEVKATKLLLECEDSHPWRAMVELAETKGMTEAELLVQAQVARICRASDYDFEHKRVRLWHPPTN